MSTGRHDIYRDVHKGIRARLAQPILDLALRVLSPDDRQRLERDLEEAQAA